MGDVWRDREDGWRDGEYSWRDGEVIWRVEEDSWRDEERIGRNVVAWRDDDGVSSAGLINDVLCGDEDGVCLELVEVGDVVCGGGAQSTEGVAVSGSNCVTTL